MHWHNTVTIDAPASRLWDLTIDVANWPSLLPTVKRVQRLDDGPLRMGSTTKIWQPGQTPAIWTVTLLDPKHTFTWQTRKLGMTMTATHLIEDRGDQCTNTLALDLTGPGAKLFGRLLGNALTKTLEIENASLKAAAAQARSEQP